MSTLKAVFREIFGLFVDDRGLALAILAVVAFVAALVGQMPERHLEAGAVLLFGCIGALVANVLRATHR
jgi:hypothetical protein